MYSNIGDVEFSMVQLLSSYPDLLLEMPRYCCPVNSFLLSFFYLKILSTEVTFYDFRAILIHTYKILKDKLIKTN